MVRSYSYYSPTFISYPYRKSTLLKVLTLQAFGGTSNGCVQLNGKDLTFDTFKKEFAFVEQHDTHWSYLSVMEHLNVLQICIFSKRPHKRGRRRFKSFLKHLDWKVHQRRGQTSSQVRIP